MSNDRIKAILENFYPAEIVKHILSSYGEIERNYRLEKWKPSELDAGHFVEAVRRLIENELTGKYTPFSSKLSTFNNVALSKYESSSGLDEYRIIIPRILFSIYCIRNKRGVGHISSINPNKLDATYILHSAKWVLGELIRLSSSISPDEAKQLVDQILYRQVDLIWDDGETFMVLNNTLKAEDKVLLVLYRQDRLAIEDLREKVQYKNKTNFKKIIVKLESKRLIAITPEGYCKLSPLGVRFVEEKILTK